MIALYIIGAILLLMLLLLLIPVGIRLHYTESLYLWIKYGFISIQVLPRKNINDEKKPKSTKSKSKDKNKNKKEKPSIEQVLQIIEKALQKIGAFLKKIRFHRLRAEIIISDTDPSNAAINYGRACAASTTLYTLLEDKLNPHDTDISVDLEYSSKSSIKLDIILNTLTINLLVVVLKILIIILPLFNEKNKKGGKINERSK